MHFVDEVTIFVQAGKGGDGSASFLREAFIEHGGPDGGDGGRGGSVYLEARSNLNTLVDFRNHPKHFAPSGQGGSGRSRTGRSGEDLIIAVPIGTLVYDADTDELIGDLVELGQRLCVAQGGRYGLGNQNFKSSTNRAPRQTTKGKPGEARNLRLELRLIADVGVIGLPNAGKSTLISRVSNARPKIADYPFTTLHPNLGVVRVSDEQSFVIADIPGLIEGAAQGAGLGVQFLRHAERTKILLHLVDIASIGMSEIAPAQAVRIVQKELEQYSEILAQKPRWLVFNKIDALLPEMVKPEIDEIVKELGWNGPVYRISTVSGEGITALCFDLMKACKE